MRTAFLVDGFNLYHSLKDASHQNGLNGQGTRWLDLSGLVRSLLPHLGRKASLVEIHYFSAIQRYLQKSNPGVVSRHQGYIKCLEASGVKVSLGRFKQKRVWCHNCNTSLTKHEEKETDVAISVRLLEGLVKNEWDAAAIVSGDTDMAPALRTAKALFPTCKLYMVFPYGRKNAELDGLVDGTFKVKLKSYLKHQFPDPVVLKDGTRVSKPSSW